MDRKTILKANHGGAALTISRYRNKYYLDGGACKNEQSYGSETAAKKGASMTIGKGIAWERVRQAA